MRRKIQIFLSSCRNSQFCRRISSFQRQRGFFNSFRACMPQVIVFPGVSLSIAAVGHNHIEVQIRIRSYSDFGSLNQLFKRVLCVHQSQFSASFAVQEPKSLSVNLYQYLQFLHQGSMLTPLLGNFMLIEFYRQLFLSVILMAISPQLSVCKISFEGKEH